MDRLVPGHWGGRMLNHEIFRVPEHLEKSAMRSCSAHELHKICHVGPQIDMHMHKLSQFGPHRCTHAQDRPAWPTDVRDTHTTPANGRRSNQPPGHPSTDTTPAPDTAPRETAPPDTAARDGGARDPAAPDTLRRGTQSSDHNLHQGNDHSPTTLFCKATFKTRTTRGLKQQHGTGDRNKALW